MTTEKAETAGKADAATPPARGLEPQSDFAKGVMAALYRAGARARRRAATVGGTVVIVVDGKIEHVAPDDPRFPRCEPKGRDLQPHF